MTAFEKSLRAMNDEALRAGAEELLTLLTAAGGVRRGRGGSGEDGGRKRRETAARAFAPNAADGSPEGGGSGETETGSAVNIPAADGEIPETARVRRDHSAPEGGGPAEEENGDGDDGSLPVPDSAAGKSDGEAWKERKNRGEPENGKDPEDRESRENPEDREKQKRTPLPEDAEAVDRAETQALEKQLESVSARRRGTLRQDGEDGTHTAAFRGPERQYEGAVGARGMEMRRISDYFRRDSRRYDTGFTRY